MPDTVRFIHTGDLHLGITAQAIPADLQGCTRVLEAAYQTLEHIVDDAIAREVDFVIFAGDIFDNPRTMFPAQVRFEAQMQRLQQADIQVYLVYGNHDPITEHIHTFHYPANVHEFDYRTVEAKHYQGKSGSCTLYGQSFGYRSMRENPVRRFKRESDATNAIGILHTGLDSTGESDYAPCSKADLKRANMDYWALGHLHKGGCVSQMPTICYCSSPQALDIGEAGSHGYWYGELSDGQMVVHDWIASGMLDFHVCEVDVSTLCEASELCDRIIQICDQHIASHPIDTVFRLVLTGERAFNPVVWNRLITTELADAIQVKLKVLDARHHITCWLDAKCIDQTVPAVDLQQAAKQNEFIAELIGAADSLEESAHIKEEALRLLVRALTEEVAL